jgi:hypothetical protein
VEQLYDINEVAVTTKLKSHLRSVMPKDDKVEEEEDGEDVKHRGEETAPGKEKPEEVEESKSEVRAVF